MTDPWEELIVLGEAGASIPLSRPIGVMLVHVELGGAVSALAGPLGGLAVLAGGSSRSLLPMAEPATPAGLVGPIQRFQAQLGPNENLVIVSAGIEDDTCPRLDVRILTDILVRSARTETVQQAAVDDAAHWLRGRVPRLSRSDLVVLAISRRAHAERCA